MKKTLFLLCAIGLHLFVLTQLRYEVWPEMIVMPYLMNHGFVLYKDMVAPYTPLLVEILKFWMGLTGVSVLSLKIFTWGLVAIIDSLIYRISLKKYGKRAAIWSLVFFVMLQPVLDGNGLWFDLAVIPLLLMAFYSRNSIFWSLAFLTKQSVIWLLPLWRKSLMKLFLITSLLVGLLLVLYAKAGAAKDFWFWAFNYTFRWFPFMPGHKDFGSWRLWAMAIFPWVVIVINFVLASKNKFSWLLDKKNPLAWSVWLIPLVLPRFGLFHFQPALAFLALGVGMFYNDYKNYKSYKNYILIYLMAVYLGFSWFRVIQAQWQKPDRFLEQEVYQTSAKLILETDQNQPVLLVNGPELAYVFSDRLPPKPWVTQFPWYLELPGYQEKLIDNYRNQNLTQIVFTPYMNEGQFVPGSYQPKKLLEYLQFEVPLQ